MLYREVGQFKTSYGADEAIFPIAQDRWSIIVLVAFAFLAVPLFAGTAIVLPLLAWWFAMKLKKRVANSE